VPVEIVSYVELRDVFPDQECTIEHLAECLRPLPLDSVLEMCARANRIASGPSDLSPMDRQRQLAGGILSQEALENLKRATQRTEDGDLPKRFLFNRRQLLELTRWALLLCDADAPPLDRSWTQDEKDLFVQAALISSWLSEGRIRAVLDENESLEALKDIALVFFRQALDAGLMGVDPWRVVGRGRKLFLEYLPKHFPDLDGQFLAATGLLPLEYVTAAGAMISMHLQLENTMIMTDARTLGSDTKYAPQYRTYQHLQVWDRDDLRAKWWPRLEAPSDSSELPGLSLRPLRDKPMISLGDGRGVIPDAIILADSLIAGPLFHLLQVADENEVFGRFGDAVEEYVRDLLASRYGTSSMLHRVFHPNVEISAAPGDGESLELDACLDYAEQLVLIEAKTVFLPDDAVMACDEARFKDDLKEKYLQGERPVGIRQLARAMRALRHGTWKGPGGNGVPPLVFPVLAVHDRLLQEPMVSAYFADLLVEELSASPVACSWQWETGNVRFAPLTILTLDDIENLENSPGIDIIDLLRSYSEAVPKHNGSVHDYIANTERFRMELRINSSLANAATEFLADCIRRVFGRDPGSGEHVDDGRSDAVA